MYLVLIFVHVLEFPLSDCVASFLAIIASLLHNNDCNNNYVHTDVMILIFVCVYVFATIRNSMRETASLSNLERRSRTHPSLPRLEVYGERVTVSPSRLLVL